MEGEEYISFGQELKDAFKPVNSWVQHGIAWLDDIQGFYRERAAIEKDYAARMGQLTKKYFEKRSTKTVALSVGDSPQMTPGSLESASMTTWSRILTATESLGKEHETLATQYSTDIADTLKALADRYEDFRKRHEKLSTKMLEERDKVYSDLKKTKATYDTQCKAVESARAKTDKAMDGGKGKAEKAYSLEVAEMNNIKNTYIIAIGVANRQKEKYYHEDLPMLIDSLQDLNETRVIKVNNIWTQASQLEVSALERCRSHLEQAIGDVALNKPHLDSIMFIKHNASDWQEPPEFQFEPSHIWHDTDQIVTDEYSKVYLRNLVLKSKRGLAEVKGEVDTKRREMEGLMRSKNSVKEDEGRAQQDTDITKGILHIWEEMLPVDTKKVTLETEIELINAAVGDLERGSHAHKFKAVSYKIPTTCDMCGEKILGFGSKGFDCKDCGYSCHQKCEMKVPATCPGVLDKAARKAYKEEARASMVPATPPIAAPVAAPSPAPSEAHGNGLKPTVSRSSIPSLARSNTTSSAMMASYAGMGASGPIGPIRQPTTKLTKAQAAHAAAAELEAEEKQNGPPAMPSRPAPTPAAKPATVAPGAPRRVLAPPPAQYVKPVELPSTPVGPRCKMLYAYTARDPEELTVDAGVEMQIVEDDDGSGWIRVKHAGSEGLVPATYIEKITPSFTQPPTSPAPSFALNLGRDRSDSVHSASSTGTNNTMKKQGPKVAPKRGAKKVKYVEALYDYEARTDGEWDMKEGDRFVLIQPDQGDGWADVELNGVTKSVPANYIQEV
ncbi:actin polymerization protein Bzz1 [Ascobolus immersus RN42]|uniref:Protein BZZ1 n=1 Tax=Ascobolus immersus RN42 TaxID=1160509 RepID=A0A3N4IN25_ASCIM|nr:actin polymerization protein Bzz1 [Ascobolus immersus RN42]